MSVRVLFIVFLALFTHRAALAQDWLIDVRTPEEYAAGHADGALNIEYQHIVAGVEKLDIPRQAPIYVYCRSGRRSELALTALRDAGDTQVQNLKTPEQAQDWQKQRAR